MNEFKLYERITNGDLRPHLERFDSQEGLNELKDNFYTKEILIGSDFFNTIDQAFDKDFHGFNDGDRFELEIDDETEPKRISIRKIPNPNEDELINLDIPPPPDEKSDIFLRIIEDEYNRITASFKMKIEKSTNIDELKLYTLKNIQFAKNTAREAYLLGKKLKKEKEDIFDNPNTYIVYVLKKHLIYSLLKIQELCSPIIDLKVQKENELEDELFEYEHSLMMSRIRVMSEDFNKMHISRLYKQIGENSAKREQIAFFTNKLKNQTEKIKIDSRSKYGVTRHDIELEKLYENELGNILSDYYLEKLEIETNEIGIIEKYEKLIKTLTEFNIKSESIETKALRRTEFFNKIQLEINLLKEIINISGLLPLTQNILKDLISLLLVLQSRKHLKLEEDEWNDYLSDLLRVKQYYVADQSRSGRSGSNVTRKYRSGELDISIRDSENNGIIKTIIETFKLDSCGPKNKIVKEHIIKLLERYDTAGNEENYIIIFSTTDSFNSLWSKYIDYIEKIVFEGNSKFQEIEYKEISKSDLKIGYNQIIRNEKDMRLYHLFVNMNIN